MLALFIVYFIFFCNVYTSQMIILSQIEIENSHLNDLYRFSFIEVDVIHQIIKSFDDYECKDFEISYPEGQVLIRFIDEMAIIHYSFNQDVYATLSYDLVFDTALDYEIIDAEIYMTIDKFED